MSKYFIVGEAYGSHEETIQHPFVGSAGHELMRMLEASGILEITSEDRENIRAWFASNAKAEFRNPYFLMLVWKNHPEIYLTNVFNLKPPGSNDIKNLCGGKKDGIPNMPSLQQGKYVDAKYEPELIRVRAEVVDQRPNCVIATGATPAWALLETSGIKAFRGAPVYSSFCGVKVFPTYHSSAVLRDWSIRPIVIADLNKAKRESEFPDIRRPQREILVEPTIADLWQFYEQYIEPAPLIAEDIENKGKIITCIGFAPRPDRAIVVPFYDLDEKRLGNAYWATQAEEREAWHFVEKVHREKKIVFQNGAYDINHLWRTMGLPVRGAEEDTMLLHHALYPELEKGLGFLGSIYTDEAAWKVIRGKNETLKKED